MTAVFIAGAGTDIGKTHVACGLIRALRARDLAVDALKPVVSGFDESDWAGSDPGQLLAALGRPLTSEALQTLSPYRYAAPLAPDLAARMEGRTVDFAAVTQLCLDRLTLMPPGTVLVIEGVGGLMSPISDTATGLDLMIALGIPAILVGGSYLGAISHTLTAWSVLRASGVAVAAIILSESEGDTPPIAEAVASLRRMTAGEPVLVVPRTGDVEPSFAALAGLIGG